MGPSFNTALLHACENTGPSVEGRKSRGRYAKIAKEQFSASYYIFCVRQHTSPQGSDNGLFGLGGRFKALHEGGDGVRQIEDAVNPVKSTSSTMAMDLEVTAFAICSSIETSVLLLSTWLPSSCS